MTSITASAGARLVASRLYWIGMTPSSGGSADARRRRPSRRRLRPTASTAGCSTTFAAQPDRGRRHRRRPAGRAPGHAALVLPDSGHRRAARPGPRDRAHSLAHLPGRPSGTPAASSSKPACARCSPGMRRVAMEYSPGCAIPYVARVDAGHDRAGPAVGRRRRLVGRSRPAVLGRLERRRDRDAPRRRPRSSTASRIARSRRSRAGCATACRRPSTTSSS